jgi:hypothetical protein
VANPGATDLILASWSLGLWFEATSKAGAAPRVKGGAEILCEVDAERVPLDLAAERISLTDDRAARRIRTARRGVHHIARLLAWTVSEAPADPLRDAHAPFIPPKRAADGIDRADRRTALRVGAARLCMHLESGSCSRTAVRQCARLAGIGSACLIPGSRATGRVEVADKLTAVLVLACGKKARHGARTSSGIATTDPVVHTEGPRIQNTEDIPLRDAACRIDAADAVAAIAVQAGRRSVWVEATSRLQVAATIAEYGGSRDTGVVPATGG